MNDMITPKQPYYLKGYTGHCPEMTKRFGSSYSALSHKILLDPLVRHSHKLVLSDTDAADYKLSQKGTQSKCDHKRGDASSESEEVCKKKGMIYKDKYKFPIAPGYTGHLPQTYDTLGDSRTVKAEETIPHLKQKLNRTNEIHKEIEKVKDLRQGRRKVKIMKDKELLQDEFALPLIDVRPEYGSITRNLFKDEEPKQTINTIKKLPYFMEGLEEGKYFIAGYTGHVPFGFAQFGDNHKNATNCALKEFTYNYNTLKSTEWAPVGTLREEPAVVTQSHKIYSEKHGLIPNYMGFVPGLQFRCGNTYGETSRDAKKWLRGDFSN